MVACLCSLHAAWSGGGGSEYVPRVGRRVECEVIFEAVREVFECGAAEYNRRGGGVIILLFWLNTSPAMIVWSTDINKVELW